MTTSTVPLAPCILRLPRCPLVAAPTPVQRLFHISEQTGAEVWVKRDDLTHAVYGGNKVRKLEWLLADAQKKDAKALVTTGAFGSHHVLATAIHGKALGLETHAVLVPQPITPHVEEIMQQMLHHEAKLYRVSRYAWVLPKLTELFLRLRVQGLRPYFIGPGGSSALGTLGYVQAAFELAWQLEQKLLPVPQAIYVTLGSGGTVAGLAVGLALAGLEIPIVAVRVVDPLFANPHTLQTLIQRTWRLIQKTEPGFFTQEVMQRLERMEQVEMDGTQLGQGYGHATEAGEAATQAMSREDIMLDPTYTAKTVAALLHPAKTACKGQPLLYWHTLNSAQVRF